MDRTVKSAEQAAAYRARWIVPIDQPPIDGGIITIAGGRIIAVGENTSGHPPRDLGDVALLPGLVNAHTHLEFSLLEKPLGEPGMLFQEWIQRVVAWRRSLPPGRVLGSDELENYQRQAIRRGLSESMVSGVAAMGDIVTSEVAGEVFASHPHIDCTAFFELLALAARHAVPTLVRGRLRVSELPSSVHGGLSPHAPYTVNPLLLTGACQESAEHRFPLAMHLAETREELQLLSAHSGPLVRALESLHAWEPDVLPARLRPLDYLTELAKAHRALVIHGNYLARDEIDFLAAHRDRLSVVYCPRTHAYFGHEPYPLAEMLAAGVRVAVGTDSRASNPDLRLLEELRHIARHHLTLPSQAVLSLGTLAGAEALGIAQNYGTIAEGKKAALCVVPLQSERSSPEETILHSNSQCTPLTSVLSAED